MKNRKIIGWSVFMIAVSFILVTVLALRSLNTVIDNNNEEMTTILASQIYDELNNELLTPIMVAQTMSHDYFLKKMFMQKDFPHDGETEEAVVSYLNSLCSGFNYNSAFVVSDKSRKYYTQKGYNKTVSPKTDTHDIWYSIFVDSNLKYDFDVDTDEVHDNQWTVFVNCRVENEDSELLGVCGVGVKMTSLQDILSKYEKRYGIKVNLIDENGLVQVDTDTINIENAVLEDAVASFKENADYTYTESDKGGYIVTKYVENFDWYLVVAKEETDAWGVYSSLILRSVLAFAVIIILLCVLMFGFLNKDWKELEIGARLDGMTGLLNKKTLIAETEEILSSFSYNTAAFVFMDLDHFKEVNDRLGHAMGDRVIKEAARGIQEIFRQDDIIGRFGGDEFCVFLKDVPENILYARLNELMDKLRAEYTDGVVTIPVTVSIGAVYYHGKHRITYQEMMEEADKALYKAKERGRDRYVFTKLS